MPRKPPQMQAKTITPEILAKINAHVASGKPTGLPPPRPGRVWSLMDSGAEPNACNHEKLFNKTVLKPDEQASTFIAADGKTQIKSGGTFDLEFGTSDGHKRKLNFRDCNVAFPIISTGRLTQDQPEGFGGDCDVPYQKHGGVITHNPAGETDRYLVALGVYWLEMIVDPALMTIPIPEGFVRQGP